MAAGSQCCHCAELPEEGLRGPAGGEELLDLLDAPVLHLHLWMHTLLHTVGHCLC